ncbi:MAG: phytoene dehydrogenase family FAD-dependent oxidoreductase [Actinomycetia bacterium]|nr:phytoene dehydrogenase family FAD-dependent oxidoreductase [Actinomycetes bacterium]
MSIRAWPVTGRQTASVSNQYDAVVVGAGPNGLTAAAAIARAGRRVLVLEAGPTIGGGTRTKALTRDGFLHDLCGTVIAMTRAPAFAGLDLEPHGLHLVTPDLALAHPLDDGRAGVVSRDWTITGESLGADADTWSRAFRPFSDNLEVLMQELSGPIVHAPRHPLRLARFGVAALLPATAYARRFHEAPARALFAGLAAHAILPLEHVTTTSFALLLGATAHADGWPFARGGTQRVSEALASIVTSAGGEIVVDRVVRNHSDLPAAPATLLDTSARDALDIAGDAIPQRVARSLRRFRPGPAAFKLDYALSAPVPWTAPPCRHAGTVHLGGTFEEVAAGERETARGGHPDRPFVLVTQPSLFDSSRAPNGLHTLWAYCHVPNGSTVDMTERIEAQIERFAPGFRDVVLERAVTTPAMFAADNRNEIGGDIGGGALDGLQLLARPRLALDPYRLAAGVYLCSASTPPGAGVHGLCGAAAAKRALRRELRG